MIAERVLEARGREGGPPREVVVRLGRPYPDPMPGGDWICPVQIAGLDDDAVVPVHGYDAVQAIQLAFQIIGARLAYPREPLALTWLGDPDPDFPLPPRP